MTFNWQGKSYQFAHIQPEPRRKSSPARPWEISIKGDCNSSSGELGIVKVALVNSTERAVMYPQRHGAHNPKARNPFEPPSYYEQGEKHYKVFCPGCAAKHDDIEEGWNRRSAFSPDPSRGLNGLRRYCKTCESEKASARYYRRKSDRNAA